MLSRIMRKTIPLLAFATLALLFSNLAAGQEGCSKFTLYAADSIDAEPGTTIDIDLAVKNTGSCAGQTMVAVDVPKGWSATPMTFETGSITTNVMHMETIQLTIPADVQSSNISLYAESAEPLTIQIIIGGSPVQNATEQDPEIPVNVTPTLPIINVTNKLPAPLEETLNESETEEVQQQTADQEPAATQGTGVTGLVTSNPAVYGAILVVFLFGAIYLYESRKLHGYSYRR